MVKRQKHLLGKIACLLLSVASMAAMNSVYATTLRDKLTNKIKQRQTELQKEKRRDQQRQTLHKLDSVLCQESMPWRQRHTTLMTIIREAEERNITIPDGIAEMIANAKDDESQRRKIEIAIAGAGDWPVAGTLVWYQYRQGKTHFQQSVYRYGHSGKGQGNHIRSD